MDAAQREYLRREIDRRRREETRLDRVVKQTARRKAKDSRPKKPNRTPGAMVPVEPIIDGLFMHAARYGWGDTPHMVFCEIGRRTGYTPRSLYRIASQKTMSFDVADYIVTRVNVHLWTQDERMREVYEAVDFRWWDPEFLRERRRESQATSRKGYKARRAKQRQDAFSRRMIERMEVEDLDQATTDLNAMREAIERDLERAPARVG